MNLNNATICGRLTKKPELKKTTTGKSVTKFSVATNYVYKDQAGKKVEEVEFHNVVCWGKMGEVIEKYFDKGDEIYIAGRLKTSHWEDKDKGKHTRTEIIGDKFEFGQKAKANRKENNQSSQNDHSQPEPMQGDEIQVESIPF